VTQRWHNERMKPARFNRLRLSRLKTLVFRYMHFWQPEEDE